MMQHALSCVGERLDAPASLIPMTKGRVKTLPYKRIARRVSAFTCVRERLDAPLTFQTGGLGGIAGSRCVMYRAP